MASGGGLGSTLDPFSSGGAFQSQDPASINQTANAEGNVTGQSISTPNGTAVLSNPGSVDPSSVNPYAAQVISNDQGLYSQFQNSVAGNAFNNNLYSAMQGRAQNQLTSSMGNQYAAMGLSGSSAEMGGLSQGIQNNQMAWLNRQQSDQMRAMSGLEGLNQQMYGDTMGIQNQYSNYEDAAAQNVLGLYGMQQQQRSAQQGQYYNMISAGMAGGGSMAGSYGNFGQQPQTNNTPDGTTSGYASDGSDMYGTGGGGSDTSGTGIANMMMSIF